MHLLVNQFLVPFFLFLALRLNLFQPFLFRCKLFLNFPNLTLGFLLQGLDLACMALAKLVHPHFHLRLLRGYLILKLHDLLLQIFDLTRVRCLRLGL